MAIRSSDGIYLEVLTTAPVVGVPIEIDVYAGHNVATMLATLEGAQEPAFVDPFGDIGSGHFRIPTSDPKATSAIIRSGNYVKVRIAGVYRYAFFLENPRKVVASTDGEAGEYWDLGGRGAIAYLERGAVYPPGWPTPTKTSHEYKGVTAAFIFDELLGAAKARGAIPQLTWDFTAARDSDNAPWTDSLTMSVPAGLSLLDLWRQFTGMGYESEMTPDLRLRFWRDRSRDFTDCVIFRAGKHIRGEVTRDAQDAGLRTRILVEGDGGRFFEVTDPDREADASVGRREGYLSFSASADPTTLQRVGDNALAQVSAASDALSVPLHHGTGAGDYEPYADYRNGDWVALDIPGTATLERVRVRSLSVKAVVGGDYEVDADFNSVALENIVRLKRIVDALGGGGSASGLVASTGGSLSSSGGASGGAGGRVAAELGDAPGYLLDKIDPTGNVVPSLVGGVGERKVRLTTTGLVNPMTTAEDLITGGAAGLPTRLGKGADGTFLGVAGGAVAYQANPVIGHEAAGDPHPGYATDADLAAHAAAGDPHPAYALDTDLATHAGAADPHTDYQKESEKGAANGYAELDAGSLVPSARLGSGTPGSATYLRGDRTWQTPPGGSGGSVTVEEADGSPSVAGVTTIKVGNGDLTDQGAGVVRIKTAADAAGGGGALTVKDDSGHTVTGVTELRFLTGWVVDLGSGVVAITIPRPSAADRASLGAYGDECNTVTPDAAWTLRNIASITGNGSAYPLLCDASGDGIWRAITDPAADVELIANVKGLTGLGNMTGLYAVDSSGNGVGFSAYDDGNAYMWTVGAYVYAGTGSNVSAGGLTTTNHWIHLRRTGSNWYGRWSNDGDAWSGWTGARADGRTITRVGFGAMYFKGTQTPELARFVYGTPAIGLA